MFDPMIQNTYLKLIDKIVQFEEDNKELFALCNGTRFIWDAKVSFFGIPVPFLGINKKTIEAMKHISNSIPSEFLWKNVSIVKFVVLGEYTNKCIDGTVEYHRPELRILFEGDTGPWGWKTIGKFWHDIYNHKKFNFQCFWAFSHDWIEQTTDSIKFLMWVIEQLPILKRSMESHAQKVKDKQKQEHDYNVEVCSEALKVI